MSDNAPADLFIAALEDLRLGVTLIGTISRMVTSKSPRWTQRWPC